MNKINPSVEIVIPVYNGSNYVREAIYSALSQTYKNCSVTVVNDGSRDNGATEYIVKSFEGRIKYLTKENGGVGSALNLALKESKSDLISWLSHDDIYGPTKIENQVKELLKHQDPFNSVVFSSYYLIDEKSNVYGQICLHDLVYVERLSWGIYPLIRSFISGCTLLIPLEVIKKENFFREDLRYTQDYELWRRIFGKTKFVYSKCNDTFVRIHGQQDSQTENNNRLVAENDVLWCNFITNLNPSHLENNVSELELKCIFSNHLKESPYFEAPKLATANLLKYVKDNFKSKQILNIYLNQVSNIYLIGFKRIEIQEIVNEISEFMKLKQLEKSKRFIFKKWKIIYERRS
jgi:glycosyltransferase involved in cell wall biosynthesis